MKTIVTAVLIIFVTTALYSQEDLSESSMSEQQKIDYLIKCVESLKDARFYRNGKEYDAKTAADHLRLKRDKVGSRLKTVEQFIEKLASHSSFSGKPYYIQYDDGTRITAKKFYQKCLADLK
ncbi:MAG: DUF5329 family protein [Spirochaetes bacterium]|jgi:hypothetical protein|nr:DUF5329 family protein [Spirochaetota bacterium]